MWFGLYARDCYSSALGSSRRCWCECSRLIVYRPLEHTDGTFQLSPLCVESFCRHFNRRPRSFFRHRNEQTRSAHRDSHPEHPQTCQDARARTRQRFLLTPLSGTVSDFSGRSRACPFFKEKLPPTSQTVIIYKCSLPAEIVLQCFPALVP